MIQGKLTSTVLWSTLAISLVALTPVGHGRPAWVDAPVSRATYVLGADAPVRLPLAELLGGEPGYSAALAQRFF